MLARPPHRTIAKWVRKHLNVHALRALHPPRHTYPMPCSLLHAGSCHDTYASCPSWSVANCNVPGVASFCPCMCGGPSPTPGPVPTPTPVVKSGCSQSYTVVSGDTCYAIAQSHGTTVAVIFSLNPTVNAGCTNLMIGQKLCLSSTTPGEPHLPHL